LGPWSPDTPNPEAALSSGSRKDTVAFLLFEKLSTLLGLLTECRSSVPCILRDGGDVVSCNSGLVINIPGLCLIYSLSWWWWWLRGKSYCPSSIAAELLKEWGWMVQQLGQQLGLFVKYFHWAGFWYVRPCFIYIYIYIYGLTSCAVRVERGWNTIDRWQLMSSWALNIFGKVDARRVIISTSDSRKRLWKK
jgi:hypothetical protein